MKKYHFTFDRIKKNKKIKKILLNKYKNYPPHLSNVIIVLGGDGFMLQTLKKYQKYKKTFLWNKLWNIWFFNEQIQNF